jgi:hypothetical protein
VGIRKTVKGWWTRLTNRVAKLVALLPDAERVEGYSRAFANAVEQIGDRAQQLGHRSLLVLDIVRKLVLAAESELPVGKAGAEKLQAIEAKLSTWYSRGEGGLEKFQVAWPVVKLFVGLFVKRLNETYPEGW